MPKLLVLVLLLLLGAYRAARNAVQIGGQGMEMGGRPTDVTCWSHQAKWHAPRCGEGQRATYATYPSQLSVRPAHQSVAKVAKGKDKGGKEKKPRGLGRHMALEMGRWAD
ncbi:hypothetical protein BS50DRAFT_623041 [Corynespora cassiicola Philippines]|uniref:Secreted protein n=1 Tax=Corynespora cassiicola Philippines TaxID=1448308 RepID=A0A2T2NGB0_CORCC|nr:hypothetical protein BS50DRAFT_623041 [Corynespora cassiicola Philippines]